MNLLHGLSEVAKLRKGHVAYIFEGEKVTYGQLEQSVDTFALGLLKIGVKKGDHIALIVGNSPQFIIGLYGAWKVGATVIPINPIYSPDEMAYILQNGDVTYIIALDVLRPVMETVLHFIPAIQCVILCETRQEKLAQETERMKSLSNVMALGNGVPLPISVAKEDIAVILYTSGTTGKPKGAMLTHHNLYSNAHDIGEYLDFSEHDRIIVTLPMFHVFCLTVALNAAFVRGATLIILAKFSPEKIFQVTKQYKTTVFPGVPTMYNFLYQYSEGKAEDVSSWRLCVSGGASMPVALLNRFEEKFQVIISEGYGLSEAAPVTTFNPVDRPRKPGSIGTNIMNVENKVVDHNGIEVAVGEVGELIVKGPNVMKGYYKMVEATKEALKDGWLYTGDLATVDEEGYFTIVDRKKEVILVGGYNVYPREVEEVLHAHESVVEAAVIGIEDNNQGEVVKAYVVVKDATLPEELLHYCELHLAKYKVPKVIQFIDELPKNSTGKIVRRMLVEIEKAKQSEV